ncbi:LysR substrate-binding domain-containing protein [Neotabrizicola sp. VNH66]|uniref:LysR substrate-binding domain-containing protein n=1 Tax=Neotabrizicola sp. VNH66 TaxID=3400918 RepID=UPI003C055BFC
MKNLTLRQFRYFEAVARLRHFGRAAEDCAVTQPALSMQIKELEETLGVALLERTARQVQLTGFGEVLLAHARKVLRAVDEIESMARAAAGDPSGALRIGVIPTIAPYLLPAIIARLQVLYPDLQPWPRETITPRLLEELIDGRLDAAILALPVSEPALTEVPLFTERFVLVRPLADAGRPTPSPQNLTEMRLLLLEEGHCFRDQALSFCGPAAARPREILDGSTLSTLVQMVGAGIGVTLIPEMAVPVETRSAPVAISRFRDPQPARSIGMVWRRSNPQETQLRQIAGVVRAAGLALRDAGGLVHPPGWRRG